MLDIFYTIFKYKEKKSPDVLGLYPERVHVAALPERRYLWTSRALVTLATVNICMALILTSSVYLMLPSKSSGVNLIKINKDINMLEIVEPSEKYVNVSDLVAEQNIYNYITSRYTITNDYDDIMSRWGQWSRIYWYSYPPVYKEFIETDFKNGLLLFAQKGLTRDVMIDWLRIIAPGLWQVQFKTFDWYPQATQPVMQSWRSTLRVGYGKITFPNKDESMKNPYGFLVLSYSLAYLGSDEIVNYMETAKKRFEQIY